MNDRATVAHIIQDVKCSHKDCELPVIGREMFRNYETNSNIVRYFCKKHEPLAEYLNNGTS